MTAGATASPWSVPSSRPPRCSGGQGSQRAQPLTRSRTPPLCTAAPARPLPHPGGPRLQSAGPGAGPAASALRPRPSHPAPPRRPPSPRPAVLHHTLRTVGPAPGGGMCHLTPTALVTLAGQVAAAGSPRSAGGHRCGLALPERRGAGPHGRPSPGVGRASALAASPSAPRLLLTPPGVKQLQPPGLRVLGWPVTRALPLSSHQPELQDKEGVLPSRPGSPTFRRMRRRGRSSCGMGGAGGTRALARPHLGSEVRGPVLGDSAVAPAADRTSARPPRPPHPFIPSLFVQQTPTECSLVPPHGRPGMGDPGR